MMRSVAGLRRLSVILVSHCHPDHVLGLPGLLATLSESRTEPLVMLGPVGLRSLVEGFRVHFGALAFPLTVREVEPGHVHPREGYRLRALAASHRVAALAWALEEDPLTGHLDEPALRRLGVPLGSERTALACGEEVVLADGRRILPGQVTGPRRPGRRIVLSGDTRPARAVEEAATGADLLVHEATFLERDRELAIRSGHSTAADAARLAARAGVGLLALVHRSSRYAWKEVLAEARPVFGATVAPQDLDLIEVPLPERGPPTLRPAGGRAGSADRSD
jgi:ribonuclease Z